MTDKIIKGLALLLILVMGAGCAGEKEVVRQWQANELVKIGDVTVTKEEAAIYGIQVKKEFEQIGGKDIWEFESFSGDKSAYEVAKTKALENIIRVKILAKKAQERKMDLDAAEMQEVEKGADQFYQEQVRDMGLQETISPDMVRQVFREFEMGRKLKKDMLKSFEPSEEMVEKKLMEEEAYLELMQEDPHEKYEQFVVEEAEITEQAKINKLQESGNQNAILTDEISQGMVYQERLYSAKDLRELYGAGLEEELRVQEVLLIGTEDGQSYKVLKLIEVRLTNANALHNALKDLEAKKQDLRNQAIEWIRDDSFNVIYKEWKKESQITINQEVWEDFVIFQLP